MSVVSLNSSLIMQSTPPGQTHVSSNGRAYCLTKSGSQRELVSHSHCLGKGSLSTADDNPFKKDIIGCAQALVEISLCTKAPWPAGQNKKEVTFHALNQVNVYARDCRWPMLETNHEYIQAVRYFLYVFWYQSPHQIFCLFI